MNSYTLDLTVANIRFLLTACNRSDYIFLKEQYKQYSNLKTMKTVAAQFVIIHKMQKKHSVSSRNNTYILHCSEAKKNFFLFSYYLRQIFLDELIRGGGCMMHASSLISNRKAYIFVGISGAGKTTVRSLFPELLSLGDDIALLNIKNGKWFLWGSPFFQRSRTIYQNINVPIAAVYELVQAKINKRKRLSIHEALSCFFKYSYSTSKKAKANGTTLHTLFKTWMKLSNSLTFYDLFFQKNRSCGSIIFKNG